MSHPMLQFTVVLSRALARFHPLQGAIERNEASAHYAPISRSLRSGAVRTVAVRTTEETTGPDPHEPLEGAWGSGQRQRAMKRDPYSFTTWRTKLEPPVLACRLYTPLCNAERSMTPERPRIGYWATCCPCTLNSVIISIASEAVILS